VAALMRERGDRSSGRRGPPGDGVSLRPSIRPYRADDLDAVVDTARQALAKPGRIMAAML